MSTLNLCRRTVQRLTKLTLYSGTLTAAKVLNQYLLESHRLATVNIKVGVRWI